MRNLRPSLLAMALTLLTTGTLTLLPGAAVPDRANRRRAPRPMPGTVPVAQPGQPDRQKSAGDLVR